MDVDSAVDARHLLRGMMNTSGAAALQRVACLFALLCLATLAAACGGPASNGESAKAMGRAPTPPSSRIAPSADSLADPNPPPDAGSSALPIETRRDDVVDVLHGVRIADPYRWLENGDDPAVKQWTERQNALTRSVLDRVPGREELHARLRELLHIGTLGAPAVRRVHAAPHRANGERTSFRYFFVRRDGDQNQPVLYVRDELDGPNRPLVDPNALASEGTVALDWWAPSQEGGLVAYGLSENGNEESTLYVRDAASGKDLPDTITRTRFSSVAWLPAGKAFFYTRYPAKGSVPEGEEHYHRKVYLHELGTDPDRADTEIFGKDRAMTDSPSVDVSPDGRWLVVTVSQGWAKTEVFIKDLHGGKAAPFVTVASGVEAIYEPLLRNDRIFMRTNEGAPRYRLFSVDPKEPERAHWKEIIAEKDDVLDGVSVVGHTIIATYLADASSRIARFGLDGRKLGDVPMPTLGSSSGASGAWDGEEAFFDFSSFAVPPQVMRLDLRTGAVEKWQEISAPIDPAAFVVERVRARSRDGTMIPAFVVHRKGLAKTGHSPLLLTGYGGFNIPVVPAFNRSSYALLEKGGILAIANLRGGGEFGESWHRAGMLGGKQHVFDDAAAVAELLIEEHYTDREHLAVMGGSNGGLLVGALITQHPDLFRAAVCSVPLLDMIRYQRFLIAKLWVPEYGSSDDPEQFPFLYAYSPYHHVEKGVRYPAVLFTTAESDSRVDPLHARKMTAALQAASSSGLPILLRVETKAGHGAGKPVTKMVEELTDIYSFLFSELGIAGVAPKAAAL